MQDWVELMDLISEDEIGWILDTGHDRRIEAGCVLVSEGTTADALYFVIDGVLEVSSAANEHGPLLLLGPGEIVGEISFLDKQPVSATVKASEDSRVLELPRHLLSHKLRSDRQFAARFYQALAVILARRLRRATQMASRGHSEKRSAAPQVTSAWESIAAALEQFKAAASITANAASKKEAPSRGLQQAEVQRTFHALLRKLEETLGNGSHEAESVRKILGRQLRQELLPYLLQARTPHRLQSKPRGYANDFQTLDLIYQSQDSGTTPLGASLDRLFLDGVVAKSLRNRRSMAAEEIRRTLADPGRNTEPARITNLASGPAAEVFDVFESLTDPKRLEATLLDFDVQALAHATREIERRNLSQTESARLINGNVVYLALGREQLDLAPQDLVYTLGLIDGFSDSICKRVIDYAHGILRPGGRILLFGFHPQNGNRALLEHVLDWSPQHRTEDDLNRLFAESAFRRPATTLRRDETGASLMAECVK